MRGARRGRAGRMEGMAAADAPDPGPGGVRSEPARHG